MKILFIAYNRNTDYLSDAVFHGLSNLDNVEVIDCNRLWYMYNDIDTKLFHNKFHGKGFTYYGSLKENNVDRNGITNKIKNKYFDIVIYGNIRRNDDFKDIVFEYYNKDKIILLDGEDDNYLRYEYVSNNTYFKRELTDKISIKYPNVKPIQFAYPLNKMVNGGFIKEKILATVIPGLSKTYIFNNEKDYFEDYRKSLFAFTWKKSGWDCLRHYEILCNACIPIFLDIMKCPNNICNSIPKDILIEYYKKSGIYYLFDMGGKFTYRNGMIINRDIYSILDINLNENFYKIYDEYVKILWKYSIENLTTNQLAKYVLGMG